MIRSNFRVLDKKYTTSRINIHTRVCDGSHDEMRARLTFICSRLNDLTDAQIDTLV